MDTNKAKKAVKKSTARKAAAEEQAAALALAALQAGAEPIDPEIQAGQVAMQPTDGYTTPFHRMGPVPPTEYYPGNLVGGPNFSGVINPVA
jgi:hypothetical protein